MGAKIGTGRLYSSKKKLVFVASDVRNGCPTINLTKSTKSAKLRDDFTKGLKGLRMRKSFAKLIFR